MAPGGVGGRRGRAVRRRLALLLTAGLMALAASSAGAFTNDFDPNTIPRLPCGSPGETRDVWCGLWLAETPTGPMWTFGPLGSFKLERIPEADARAREGTQFGDFNYAVKCFSGALFYAGSYGADAGRMLACTNGSVLKGFYRSQNPENTGPGAALRSGEFEITHSLGGTGNSNFAGTITQHFVGTTNWTGHCLDGTCDATSVTAPAVPPGAAPGQPPIAGPPLFRIVGIGHNPTHRSGVDGVVRAPQIGWLLGAKDIITVPVALNIKTQSDIVLEKLPGGERIEIDSALYVRRHTGDTVRVPARFEIEERPVLLQGRATVTTTGARTNATGMQLPGLELLTPVSRVVPSGGVATVDHDPLQGVTTVANLRGSVLVTRRAGGRDVRLAPGRQVDVAKGGITAPLALVPNLRTTIPNPREFRAGPLLVTGPSQVSLRSLRRSRCVAVSVSSARPARVLVTLYSGRGSLRLFGQRLLVFTAPGRTSACIAVPRHARSFDVRARLRLAVGYKVGGRAGGPVIRPVGLVP